jgi:glycosyltransferase involved in cell wall biosynthesis
MKIAFVIHRYAKSIVGGSEFHCRRMAEEMASRHEVEVLTTTAEDYVTWKDGFAPGLETIDGVKVRRFRIKARRNLVRFKEISDFCFYEKAHTADDEREWVRANGPETPELLQFIRDHKADYDVFIFYSFRYYPSYFGLLEVAEKSILVPTAEEDAAVHLSIFADYFNRPAGALFLTPEEQDLVGRVAHGVLPPSDIIGFAVDIPPGLDAAAFRKRHDLSHPYLIYVGRIDRNKGCDGLFRYFLEYDRRKTHDVDLVLAGTRALDIPNHTRVKYLGFLTDTEKFEALQSSELLVMPSPYESLSIVVLEAWAMGKATLVNGLCKVLRGQSRRSNGGLFFSNFSEFCEGLDFLLENPEIREALGRSGRDWLATNFSWTRLLDKIDDLVGRTIKRS